MLHVILLITILLLTPKCLAHKVKEILDKAHKIGAPIVQKLEIIDYFNDYMQHYNDYLSDTSNTKALNSMADSYHLPAF